MGSSGAVATLALVQGASLYCYGVDFNKDVSEVFDAQGTIAAAYDYSPYGAVTGTGSLVQPVQWSGEMHDEEPALVYYNYRFYNPKTAGGSIAIPSLKKGDGDCTGLLIIILLIVLILMGEVLYMELLDKL